MSTKEVVSVKEAPVKEALDPLNHPFWVRVRKTQLVLGIIAALVGISTGLVTLIPLFVNPSTSSAINHVVNSFITFGDSDLRSFSPFVSPMAKWIFAVGTAFTTAYEIYGKLKTLEQRRSWQKNRRGSPRVRLTDEKSKNYRNTKYSGKYRGFLK